MYDTPMLLGKILIANTHAFLASIEQNWGFEAILFNPQNSSTKFYKQILQIFFSANGKSWILFSFFGDSIIVSWIGLLKQCAKSFF